MENEDLTRTIIGCAYKVHSALGIGFVEKVYENALRIELDKLGFRIKQQEPIDVLYEGQFCPTEVPTSIPEWQAR
jgi:GxxExxY protein